MCEGFYTPAEQNAYRAGWDAACHDDTEKDCPFAQGDERSAWLEGFRDCRGGHVYGWAPGALPVKVG